MGLKSQRRFRSTPPPQKKRSRLQSAAEFATRSFPKLLYTEPGMKESNLTPEKAEFLYRHCEKRLLATLDARRDLEKKGNYVLVALGAILALLLRSYPTAELAIGEIGLVSYVLLLMAATFWYCLRAQDCSPPGNHPSHLLTDRFCENDLPVMIINELRNYEKRIRGNDSGNSRIAICLNRIIWGMLAIPIGVVVLKSIS